jgi:pimeloyl-ACP methyl ester carboxylesterase
MEDPMAESRFITAADGLKLHAVEYGLARPPRLPVVCLPGLSRTAGDFTALATALAVDRRVLALDLRGRGRSGYDPDPSHYVIEVEAVDVVAVLTALAAMPAIIVGTSRGGLVAMTLAEKRPDVLAGVVLNDIGPVVDMTGLMRIKGYVGKLPPPRNFQEAAEMLRGASGGQFPNLTDADWLTAAHRAFREDNGRLVTTYDPALTRTLRDVEPDEPYPTMWPQFDAMARVPVMVVHGARSDILMTGTVTQMQAHRPDLEVHVVGDQGHAPLLADAATIGAIAAFAAKCDALHEKSRPKS